MKVNHWNGLVVFYLVLVFGIISCYTPQDGCLDPESTNYSIVGDRDCEDCCVYPTIKLSVFHQNGDTTLFLDNNDTLINNLGQEYSIVKYVYFLSDFKMETPDGPVEVQDSIQLDIPDGTIHTKDDVIRVRRDGFSYVFGTIIFDGEVSEVSFKLGLPELLNTNRFTSEVPSHPLTNDPDSLFRDTEGDYVFQRIQIAQGVDFRDTVIYDIVGQNTVQEIVVPLSYVSERGKDKTLIIEARYDIWFEDVDFIQMNKEEIETQIMENSSTMFFERK